MRNDMSFSFDIDLVAELNQKMRVLKDNGGVGVESRWIVVDDNGFLQVGGRHETYDEAMELAQRYAKDYPGDEYFVAFLDTRVIAERPEPVVTASVYF